MELIKPGRYIDFMRYRRPVIAVSVLLVLASLGSFFVPGPNYGIDFRGGTEVQVVFKGNVSSGELRKAIERMGYERPDVVKVQGAQNEYIVRIQEVSSLTDEQVKQVAENVKSRFDSVKLLSQGKELVGVSPGGDKITFSFSGPVEQSALRGAVEAAGVGVRAVNRYGPAADHRYEVQLTGVADVLVEGLRQKLGERGPETPRRVEWVGPKAGEQLRDAAIKSLLYAIGFIMVYVAFRFDLRFAPGGVLAMIHDALITIGVYVVLQKEVNLTTVAALLTILGYSINDTIVVYDRIRENMARMREKGLRELINLSTSQMFSRTIVTSTTTLLSVAAFFIWGTSVIRDIAFALMIGIFVGTYSSIYIAAPVTEWMDRKLFNRPGVA